ncbi:hypothetical protein Goshw_009503 [Gossypium schwendimanii]|uniref:AMP-dependent synthetase/ligase domain-containing protein n=1 Tax=Gossypium schwendimanii TaxID=34291 RepID=A0A7J9MSN2_GOSSC|nr:hypothetical protein [Gossypium schwendimanii]
MELLLPNPANSTPLTTLGFLDRAATAYGDSPSIVYNNVSYTWLQTHCRCLQMASSLTSLGIQRGQVVSVVAPNVPSMYELQFAVPMSGAVLNNINTRLDAHTLNTKHLQLILIDDEMVSLGSKSTLSNSHFLDHYEGILEDGDPKFKWLRPKSEWDPIVLNYTSSTTSCPKGVSLSHRAILKKTMDALVDWSVSNQPVYLWTLPIFHANGWSFPWGMAVVGGTNICLCKVDHSQIYRLVQQHKVTHMYGAPVVLNMLSNSPNLKTLDHYVQILTAGSPLPAPVLAKTESMGFVVSHGYRLTETGGIVVSWYLKDTKGTCKCMRENGWFYTGDVGVIHPDGYLEIKDRSKDIIISDGENISVSKLESVLYSHPAVNEAAAVAKP